jgi:hypothetical protein
MQRASDREFGEKELAQLNARDDLSSAFGADDWDEAVAAGAPDYSVLGGSFAPASGGNDYE